MVLVALNTLVWAVSHFQPTSVRMNRDIWPCAAGMLPPSSKSSPSNEDPPTCAPFQLSDKQLTGGHDLYVEEEMKTMEYCMPTTNAVPVERQHPLSKVSPFVAL